MQREPKMDNKEDVAAMMVRASSTSNLVSLFLESLVKNTAAFIKSLDGSSKYTGHIEF